MAINIEHLGVDSLDWVADGCPAESIRRKLDELFVSWVEHLNRGEQAPGRGHRPAADATNPNRDLDPRRRRRAQFSAIQHLYGRKPSACTHKVLDRSWESGDPGLAPTLEQLHSTWQPIFETPSIKDNRQPAGVGPVKWELVAPVTPDDLKQMLTEGASSAPGPDGVRLKDVIGLRMEELCSHYNLWLLCGSQPTAICRGRTIFILKGCTAPSLLHHIFCELSIRSWLADMMFSCPLNTHKRGFRKVMGLLNMCSPCRPSLMRPSVSPGRSNSAGLPGCT